MAAVQNPLVLNPIIKLSAKSTIKTLIMRETIPSVSQFSGAVIIFNKYPIVALIIPRTTAKIHAVKIPSTSTPGTTYAAPKTANDDSKRERRNLIVKRLKNRGKNSISHNFLLQSKCFFICFDVFLIFFDIKIKRSKEIYLLV